MLKNINPGYPVNPFNLFVREESTIKAEPFYLPGGSTGCLLIHGFGGSPLEMTPLGEYLHSEGMTVSAVMLAGHGTTPSDLRGKSWADWISSAVAGLEKLKSSCAHVFVIGFSMGGTISLHLAANYPVDGVITVCAPVYLDTSAAPLTTSYILKK